MTFYVKSPARKIVSRISKGDYSDIEQLYKNDVKDHVIQEMLLDKLAEKDCATVLDDFKAEKLHMRKPVKIKCISYAGI